MRIAVISGLEYEIDVLEEMMGDFLEDEICGTRMSQGILSGHTVFAVLSGLGKVPAAMATQAAICEYMPDLVINIGLAGGCSANLRKKDAVIAGKLVYHDAGPDGPSFKCDPGMTALAAQVVQEAGLRFQQGTVATGDRFIDRAELRRDIVERTGCLCVDRSACAVAEVCAKNAVPFLSVKIISDTADEDAGGEYAYSVVEYSELSARIIRRICSSIRVS